MTRPIVSAVLAMACAFAPPWASALPPADIYAKLAASVWRVTTYDEDGLPLSIGSAVVVAPGMLVTNCHVLAKAHRVAVKHEKQTLPAELAMWDPERDVCEIRATALPAAAVTLGDVASLRVGQPVYTIGNPRGLDLTMSDGLLSSIRRNDQDRVYLLQTSASISQGSSGGGLFDDQGRLIGLTTLVVTGAKPGEAQNLNFAVPVDWVRQLPERFARLQAPAGAASAASGAAGASTVEAAIANLMPSTARPAAHAAPTIDIADDAHLPFSNEKMREGYQRFLSHMPPRAFVIGENGSFVSAWRSPEELKPNSFADAAQRAVYDCQRRSATRCLVYAVDDRVVYDPAKR